ncbi:MAG: MerR family transcriptional regulator [Bacteroidota bacterium]
MFTVGQVAKRFSLSRSTLLYYDKQGVLKPSARNNSNYRMYSDGDVQKLERIVLLRNAGLSLADIVKVIDKDFDETGKVLENRLFSLNKEIQDLRCQQCVIIDIIKRQGSIKNTRIITMDIWVSMLRAAGLDEQGMWNWHIAFESSSPEAHQDFLESLGISSEEVTFIREQSVKR